LNKVYKNFDGFKKVICLDNKKSNSINSNILYPELIKENDYMISEDGESVNNKSICGSSADSED